LRFSRPGAGINAVKLREKNQKHFLVSSPQAKKFFPARSIFAKGENAAG
jgi:hypothetical protein